MLSEQTVALGAGWESMNIQLDGAEAQSERGTREEGLWRTAPGPVEHLHCDLQEEPQSLQEKGESTRSLLVSDQKVALKTPNLAGYVARTCTPIPWRLR